MTVSDLNPNEYSNYYKSYIDKASNLDLLAGLKQSGEETLSFFESIPESKHEYTYDNGKWTIKELLLHLMDAERVFIYRALRFARNDDTALPGFDENYYANQSQANNYSMMQLLKSYEVLRAYTVNLFESFTNDMLMRIGEASRATMSVRAIGFATIGHEKHHIQVIKERYL